MLKNSSYTIEFFDAQSGYRSARLIGTDLPTLHLHSLVKPENESKYYNDISIWGDKLILLGSGLGYHLMGQEVLKTKKILIVDYYKQCADFCRSEILADCTSAEVISSESDMIDEKVKKFTGDGTGIQIIRHPVAYKVNKQFYDSVLQMISLKAVHKVKSGKILILTGTFFMQEELVDACSQAGFVAMTFNADKMNGIIQYESKLEMLIQKEKPDLVLSVNMKGIDGSGILCELTERNGIPVAVWFVDDPRPILLHQQKFVNSNIFAFCWEKNYLPFLKKCGFAKAEYLPLATDPDRFITDGPRIRAARLGFVGSSMGKDFLQEIASKFLWRSELDPLVRTVARMLITDKTCDVLSEVRKICTDMSIDYPYSDQRNDIWFQSYIIHTASMLKRKSLVEHLKIRNLELFGDPHGWNQLIGNSVVCHPDIDYRTQLASVYRSIIINVNSTSCQMASAVNQRVFDIPACGGFVVSDSQTDIFELFSTDEIVTYDSLDELTEKIDYYSEHEKERQNISFRARMHIISEHTVKNRLQKIEQLI